MPRFCIAATARCSGLEETHLLLLTALHTLLVAHPVARANTQTPESQIVLNMEGTQPPHERQTLVIHQRCTLVGDADISSFTEGFLRQEIRPLRGETEIFM